MSRMVSPDGSDQADSGRGVNLTAELQQIVSPTESVGIADRLVRCYPLLHSLLATDTARVRDRRISGTPALRFWQLAVNRCQICQEHKR